MSAVTSGPVPIFRMTGVTKDGNSIMTHVHGFSPYFYVPAPEGFTAEKHSGPFRVIFMCMLFYHKDLTLMLIFWITFLMQIFLGLFRRS